MAEQKFMELIKQLEDEIERADIAAQNRMKRRLQTVINDIKQTGAPVPTRLVAMKSRLNDEAMESMFDNMPV